MNGPFAEYKDSRQNLKVNWSPDKQLKLLQLIGNNYNLYTVTIYKVSYSGGSTGK
jgi:hypothetical protein